MLKQKLLYAAYLVVVCLMLVLAMELCSLWHLKKRGMAQAFLVNDKSLESNANSYQSYEFDLIDPLLGWGRTATRVKEAGYSFTNNCVALKERNDSIVIIITGGSTSDVILHPRNWPVALQKMLDEKAIPATVIVAAVGGYNSGQELLKMIRDGIACKPTIHLSYCGANEVESPSYVSPYEDVAYKNIVGGGVPNYLPNTVVALRLWKASGDVKLSLQEPMELLPSDFYAKNMCLMNGISHANGYRFCGILQPVINSGKYHQADTADVNDFHPKLYRQHYPTMQAFADSTAYMANFSAAFDTCTGKVFVDDCHLTDAYQNVIAQKVFEELIKRNFLKAENQTKNQ